MPSIVVLEKDETTAGTAAGTYDVAYVPGFANTNNNYYILTVSGKTPQGLVGTITDKEATSENIHSLQDGATAPQYACNTVDKITWMFKATNRDAGRNTSGTWTTQDTYIAPTPENYPVYCSTIANFEAYFGSKPYEFVEDQDVKDLFKSGVIAKGYSKMYKAGDFDRSYLYAKELIKAGIPVIYENIVDRGSKNFAIETKKYVRNRITIKTWTVDSAKYIAAVGETLAASSLIFHWTLGGKWRCDLDNQIELTMGTEISVDPSNVTFYVGDEIIVAPGSTSGTFGVEFNKCADPEVDVNSTVLENYMSETETYSIDTSFVYNGTEWKNGDKVVNIAELGITISGIIAANDNIKLKASLEVSYAKNKCTVKKLYDYLDDSDISPYTNADKLSDKGEITVKYITSGAYPVYELLSHQVLSKMITCAYNRGDAVALIDHANNPQRSLKVAATSGSVYAHVVKTTDHGLMGSDEYNSFGAMFTPWATYNCTTAPKGKSVQLMPASFAYLTTLAASIKTNANFLAVAGVNRGLPSSIVELNTIERLSNTIADAYQPRNYRAINPITNIQPYGLTIWGNRTLVSNADGNLTALSFLNVRNMVSDIKKVSYVAAKKIIFEQDSEITWNNFKYSITPTLDQMVNGYGLSSYKIVRGTTHFNGTALAKGEIAAVIKIVPMYAIEDVEITVVMNDEGNVSIS